MEKERRRRNVKGRRVCWYIIGKGDHIQSATIDPRASSAGPAQSMGLCLWPSGIFQASWPVLPIFQCHLGGRTKRDIKKAPKRRGLGDEFLGLPPVFLGCAVQSSATRILAIMWRQHHQMPAGGVEMNCNARQLPKEPAYGLGPLEQWFAATHWYATNDP